MIIWHQSIARGPCSKWERQIRKQNPKVKVLMLSSSDNAADVKELVDAGAAGYVTRHTGKDDIFRAIRNLARGKTVFRPSLSKALVRPSRKSMRSGGGFRGPPPLTPRETQILKLIAEGKSNKMMAQCLRISPKTVEKHRQRVMDKIDLHEPASLTRYALATRVSQLCNLAGAISCSANPGHSRITP